MSNFFADQARAKRRSGVLFVVFGLVMLAVMGAISLVLIVGLGLVNLNDSVVAQSFVGTGFVPWLLANWQGLLTAAAITFVVMAGASLVKIAQFSSGGSAVARELGGNRLDDQPGDPRHRRLKNVVEEVAIAAGVPVPDVFVLQNEPGINAFAAGFTPGDAAIALSDGALEYLTRDELQGVVAHEFSHIFNGDMRLNTRMMGLLFGVQVFAILGLRLIRSQRHFRVSSSRAKDGAGLAMFGVALLVVGSVGHFGARLVQAMISREREWLADASAVQFTRNPEGIGGALKKIAALSHGSRLLTPMASEASHMFFADGLGTKWFATHPPLIDRIKKIQPAFHPVLLEKLAASMRDMRRSKPDPSSIGRRDRSSTKTPQAPVSELAPTARVSPEPVSDRAGEVTAAGLQQAQALHQAIPIEVQHAAHDHNLAPVLVTTMLLHREPGPHRDTQLAAMQTTLGTSSEIITQLESVLAKLSGLQRLPVAELAFPALKHRPRDEVIALVALIDQMIQADGAIGVFEYALGAMLARHLRQALSPQAERAPKTSLRAARHDLAFAFSVLAHFGHKEEASARRAFTRGFNHVFHASNIAYQPPGPDWVTRLDAVMFRLDGLPPLIKAELVDGFAKTVANDGKLARHEAELLRAYCDLLGVPLPAMLGI